MKPLKLTIQAFGSYRKRTLIDFEEPNQNLFLITGDTGAGKTTIFDAIVFALYGEASSTANKKDGIILQSQFADLNLEPFVELTFSEGYNSDSDIYTVRRVPRHLKTVTRGATKGIATREISASVTLTMPDGTEYPSKETDKKLEEIVGLTKRQFMQVAMIAQGEFMELLRAKSDDKKVIFRKLFNTELFQGIVDELNNRKRNKERDLAIIKTEVQTVVARVVAPKEYNQQDHLNALRKRIKDGELVLMEQFLDELKILCAKLKENTEEANQAYQEANIIRDSKRDDYHKAENLLKFFKQLDKAEKDLIECRLAEEELKDAKVEKVYDQALAHFSKISDRVDKALVVFKRIDALQKEVKEKEKVLKSTEKKVSDLQKKLVDLQLKEEEWKRQSEELESAGKMLVQCESQMRELSVLKEDVIELVDLQDKIRQLQVKKEQSRSNYAWARMQYLSKSREYEGKRQAFLDAQAGFLAKELVDGKPCPVCGSLEHPNPCSWNEMHSDLSEEVIRTLAEEVEKIRLKQQELAAESRSNADLLLARENSQKQALKKLHQRMKISISDIPEDLNLEMARKCLDNWEQSVNLQEEQLKEKIKKFEKIQKSLQDVDKKRADLKECIDEANEDIMNAKAALESSKAIHQDLEQSKDYPTKEAAEKDLKQALREKTLADELKKKVDAYHNKLTVAKSLKISALEVIGNQKRPVMEEILSQMEAAEEKRSALASIYEKCKEDYKINKGVYDELKPKMDIRQKIIAEHTKLDVLYRMMSGNVSGSRMDLETYVQRHYLERILYAANSRFLDMSAGQFELRMVDIEKAGEGKNRGLDLMVYSNVTGKEREVRTLSGGESFMAALALALGMADQIQENSAAINLDMMFIDEGFGSLDEHSRNQAVKVLLEMAEGSKLIGIISHVTELKQEIEDQLLVSKDENGSHVKWQIS